MDNSKSLILAVPQSAQPENGRSSTANRMACCEDSVSFYTLSGLCSNDPFLLRTPMTSLLKITTLPCGSNIFSLFSNSTLHPGVASGWFRAGQVPSQRITPLREALFTKPSSSRFPLEPGVGGRVPLHFSCPAVPCYLCGFPMCAAYIFVTSPFHTASWAVAKGLAV